MTVPAEAPEFVEQGADCTDQLGHWMCGSCNRLGPEGPIHGVVYLALCGIRKTYEGPAWHRMPCAVCNDLRRQQCVRCGQ